MSTRFIGYEPKSGTYVNAQTGTPSAYSNRKVRFITDDSQSKDNRGFSYYEFKLKRAVVADIFGVEDTDEAVNKILDDMILKFVTVSFAPVNGELSIVNIQLVNTGNTK